MAASEASAKAGRLANTPNNDTLVNGRLSLAATYDLGETSELEDPSQMLWDPNSNLVKAVGMGMSRQYDRIIIAAAQGDSRDQAGVAVPFPAAQVIGDGTAPLSYDMVTEVQEIHLTNDIDPDVPKVMVIGPTQMRKLLQITEATNADYINVKALASDGFIHSWMGHTWVVSTLLGEPAPGEIECFSMTHDAIGFHMPGSVTTDVAKDPSKSFAWRIYCQATFGAIRVEDEKLVKLHLADTL